MPFFRVTFYYVDEDDKDEEAHLPMESFVNGWWAKAGDAVLIECHGTIITRILSPYVAQPLPHGEFPSMLIRVSPHEPAGSESWPRKGQHIRQSDLIRLIEENDGSTGLDLRGTSLVGDGDETVPTENPIDLSDEAIQSELESRGKAVSETTPSWFSTWTSGFSLYGAQLQHATLFFPRLQRADLRDTQLQGTSFWGARLQGASLDFADARGAHFIGASLRGASLSAADLRGAEFKGADLRSADLTGAKLEELDLSDTYSLAGVHITGARLYRTLVTRDKFGGFIGEERDAKRKGGLGQFFSAAEGYLALKTNFVQLGQYEDASWAHIKERQMRKASYFPTSIGARWVLIKTVTRVSRLSRPVQRLPISSRRWVRRLLAQAVSGWFHLRLFFGLAPPTVRRLLTERDPRGNPRHERLGRFRWASSWTYELLTGYGERPLLPLAWATSFATIFFPLLYWAIGALPGHGRAFTSSSPSDIDWAGWGDSLVFSMTSFGTLSFSRLQPEGTLPNLIAAFEAMIGVLLFALFVFTLGNRMSRS